MRTMLSEEQKRLAAVHHVVHDYTNLVSSGALTQTNIKPPINTHVQHAFLMNCRKMAGFFLNLKGQKHANDILSKHYFPPDEKVVFKLSTWREQWNEAMNRQLLHLSYDRIDKAKPWDGKPNQMLLDEFQAAWKKFRANLEEPYKSKFKSEIADKLKPRSEFQHLDLW